MIVPSLLIAIILAASTSTPWPQITTRLERYSDELSRLGRFSGVVLVSRGSDVYQSAHGFADIARREPNTLQTQFEIASLSKMFTAAAILKLRDADRLRLSDPLCTYLPGCPATWQPITIDEVLHHRSGIPDYEDSLDIESPAYYAFMTAPNDAHRILEREMPLPLDFLPGTKFSYSNTGYVALGYVVEAASHESYAAFLRRTIFTPAGMHDTGVIGVDSAPRLAIGYKTPSVGWEQRLPGFRFEEVSLKPVPTLALTAPHGDGGIFSTAGDLLRWTRVMMGSDNALESSTERAEILTGVEGYGDGWMVGTAFGQPQLFHTGELPGVLTNGAIFPQAATAVIILDNVDLPLRQIVRDVRAIALNQPYDPPLSGAMIALTAQQTAPLIGQYALASGKIVCVAVSKTMLEAAIKDQFTAGLLPFAPDRFFMPLSSGQVTFTLAPGGSASALNMRYNGIDHPASRTSDPCPNGTKL